MKTKTALGGENIGGFENVTDFGRNFGTSRTRFAGAS